MTDQEPIAAAILAALTGAGLPAYERDGVPGTNGNPGDTPARTVVIDLSREFISEPRRHGGDYMLTGYFLKTIYRAPNIQSCRELRRITSLTLEGKTVGTWGPFTFNQEEQPIDDDPDWGWVGTDAWFFC